jgi:hypothetical protein
MDIVLRPIQSRYETSIYRYPTIDNDFTLIIDFNDNPHDGPAWYIAEIDYTVEVDVDLAVNEIRTDQPGADYDEYFELSGAPGTYLDGMTYVVVGDGSGGSGVIEEAIDLTGNVIPGSDYFVAAEGSFSLGTADLTVNLNFENSDNVTHMLVRDFTGHIGMDIDTDDDGFLDIEPWSEMIDSVALIETPGGGDRVYSPNIVGPDGSFVPAHVFLCAASWQIGDFSISDDTPGAQNNCQVPPGGIVINEILQNPSVVSDSAGEWFELYNVTGMDIDIDGWTIADNDFDLHVIDNGGPLVIPAGGYLVLGRNGDSGTNGGVSIDYVYPSDWFLSNSTDEIVLYDYLGNETDRVEYDGGATFPDPNGATMSLADPALDNNSGTNWCEASTPYGGGDMGTPGAANDCLTGNSPPDCADAYPSRDTLWPPNHKFVAVDIFGVTDADGDPVTITIDGITHDEPEDGAGDGSFAPDSRGVGSSTAELRAERDGSGDGREYVISFTATDDSGGECSGEVTVAVPKSKRK